MRDRRLIVASVLGGMLGLGFAAVGLADDRALLVGLGQNSDPAVKPLPGIDLDLDMMRSVSRVLGFAPSQIKVLENEAATDDAVRDALSTWLVDGVGEQDRVLFYFSGHGTRVVDLDGDEDDGLDEALVLYNARASQDGMTGILVDDELGALLRQVPSRNVLVLLDSCHSGTGTRSLDVQQIGTAEGIVKYHPVGNPGSAPIASPSERTLARVPAQAAPVVDAPRDAPPNYLALSAAGDDEQSLATQRGSIFTLGLHHKITAAAKEGRDLTPRQLNKALTDFVIGALPSGSRFYPRLDGHPALMDKAIGVVRSDAGEGPNRERLQEQLGGAPVIAMRTVSGRTSFSVGEKLELELDVPVAGWLSVVAIDKNDVAEILLPNRYVAEQRVEPGRFRIPNSDWPADVVLQAIEPGETAVYALITAEPLGLFDSADGQRDRQGQITSLFGVLSPVGSKAIERHPARVGQVVLNVCEGRGDCE
ncbi:MAG: DUF4384 domain-containing protein [Gammaproteobacteria bacterium]|nr:DUF4384 domain-containing protein [Gammaproteobacteria bacterium]